jgi:prepilin-type N-terminal cleavage/methylation domain-containing protein
MIKNHDNQQGFTIIELMIATSILSVILVIATAVITGIGVLYYKGVNQVRVQDNVRNISDDLTQHLQLSGTADVPPVPPVGGVGVICIGTTRYSYILGAKIGTNIAMGDSPHVLWRDTVAAGSCTAIDLTAITAATPGDELIAQNSRLTAFEVSGSGLFTVRVGVAYGDSDLLTTPSGVNIYDENSRCSGGPGKQFCATAYLLTSTTKRGL